MNRVSSSPAIIEPLHPSSICCPIHIRLMSILQTFGWYFSRCCDLGIVANTILASVIGITCFSFFWDHGPTRISPRLPPGPRQLPFIGNAHQLPEEYQQNAFAEWGKKFGMLWGNRDRPSRTDLCLLGALVHAQFFNTSVLVLNHTHTARALLEKRGAKYSSRAYFTFQEDM